MIWLIDSFIDQMMALAVLETLLWERNDGVVTLMLQHDVVELVLEVMYSTHLPLIE